MPDVRRGPSPDARKKNSSSCSKAPRSCGSMNGWPIWPTVCATKTLRACATGSPHSNASSTNSDDSSNSAASKPASSHPHSSPAPSTPSSFPADGSLDENCPDTQEPKPSSPAHSHSQRPHQRRTPPTRRTASTTCPPSTHYSTTPPPGYEFYPST